MNAHEAVGLVGMPLCIRGEGPIPCECGPAGRARAEPSPRALPGEVRRRLPRTSTRNQRAGLPSRCLVGSPARFRGDALAQAAGVFACFGVRALAFGGVGKGAVARRFVAVVAAAAVVLSVPSLLGSVHDLHLHSGDKKNHLKGETYSM